MAHAWQLLEVNLEVVGYPTRTMEEYQNTTFTYDSQEDVKAKCIYDSYEMPIITWPANKRMADIAVNPIHECTAMPDPDPYPAPEPDPSGR